MMAEEQEEADYQAECQAEAETQGRAEEAMAAEAENEAELKNEEIRAMDKFNKDFEELFPSLKDNDYCSFDQIQKDKLMAVCLDKQKVFFYRCAKCGKCTFQDINNKKEQHICLDCAEKKVKDAIRKSTYDIEGHKVIAYHNFLEKLGLEKCK